jgi:hypothetical protein
VVVEAEVREVGAAVEVAVVADLGGVPDRGVGGRRPKDVAGASVGEGELARRTVDRVARGVGEVEVEGEVVGRLEVDGRVVRGPEDDSPLPGGGRVAAAAGGVQQAQGAGDRLAGANRCRVRLVET